ncbi:hypothetical protein M2281_002881 [Mesorhizobium soli]|nr:hypothetical protein [Mesorhizobium soli]
MRGIVVSYERSVAGGGTSGSKEHETGIAVADLFRTDFIADVDQQMRLECCPCRIRLLTDDPLIDARESNNSNPMYRSSS